MAKPNLAKPSRRPDYGAMLTVARRSTIIAVVA